MTPDSNLVEYYAKRASEYEKIYLKPERQKDLAFLRQRLPEELAGEDVLEIACGTGYWTQLAAQTAHSILAMDINEEVLQIARAKTYPKGNVVFEKRDLFQLSGLTGRFTAGLVAFWWSHLKKSEIAEFLRHFHQALAPDAKVVFMDNNYVPGSSFPISRTDDEGNTYQLRTLENGTEYEVLKNFPTESELRQVVDGFTKNIHFFNLTHYWLLSYRKA
ncbi:MAG: class I SAM-dependent methyltransferase [candidate division Zixibacteria bacterium]|nr:class I SAM-dependent methyltransferase [candidate division Zixibacteria bacterium]